MKKIILVLVIVFALCAVGFFAVSYVVLKRQPQDDGGTYDPFIFDTRPPSATSGTPVNVPPGGTSTTGSSYIGKLSVEQLLHESDTYADPYNDGYYFLGNRFPSFDGPATNSPPYIIMFIAFGQHFSVALLQEPIKQSRLEAERYLTAKLGLTPEQLCGLNYMVTVPVDANETYASINLKFSACPDAIFLP